MDVNLTNDQSEQKEGTVDDDEHGLDMRVWCDEREDGDLCLVQKDEEKETMEMKEESDSEDETSFATCKTSNSQLSEDKDELVTDYRDSIECIIDQLISSEGKVPHWARNAAKAIGRLDPLDQDDEEDENDIYWNEWENENQFDQIIDSQLELVKKSQNKEKTTNEALKMNTDDLHVTFEPYVYKERAKMDAGKVWVEKSRSGTSDYTRAHRRGNVSSLVNHFETLKL